MTTLTEIHTLDELLHVLITEANTPETADRHGLPRDPTTGAIDLTELPTFGGSTPASTRDVLSWDATRLLVHATAPLAGLEYGNGLRALGRGFRIISRSASLTTIDAGV